MSHDIGVITSSDDETSAVIEVFGLRSCGAATFDGDVALRQGAVRLVCVQGDDDAGVLLRERFAPPIVALVGVAERADARVHAGDVVVSDEVAGVAVAPLVMRRAVNHFFSIQAIEWAEEPYRVVRDLAFDRRCLAVARGCPPESTAPLHGWLAVLGVGAGRSAAHHAATVFRAMLPVLVRRPALIGSRI